MSKLPPLPKGVQLSPQIQTLHALIRAVDLLERVVDRFCSEGEDEEEVQEVVAKPNKAPKKAAPKPSKNSKKTKESSPEDIVSVSS